MKEQILALSCLDFKYGYNVFFVVFYYYCFISIIIYLFVRRIFILFNSAFIATYYLTFIAYLLSYIYTNIDNMHIYIFYILVHIAQAVPVVMLIYSLNHFTNKVCHNNNNNTNNNNNSRWTALRNQTESFGNIELHQTRWRELGKWASRNILQKEVRNFPPKEIE